MKRQDIKAIVVFTVVSAFGVGLTALYLAGHKSVEAEIVIPAPPSKVWAVITDPDTYADWHPVIRPIAGRLESGQTVTHAMTLEDGSVSEVEAAVVRVEDERLLNQYGGVPLVLTFDHRFELEAVEGGTRLRQHEEYRGIAVPFWDPASVGAGYAEANKRLRAFIMARSDG